MLFIVDITSFIICVKWMTMTEHFLWFPEYVLLELSFKSHEKQLYGKSLKGGFCAISKLVYSKTQLLELIESSMKVPYWFLIS